MQPQDHSVDNLNEKSENNNLTNNPENNNLTNNSENNNLNINESEKQEIDLSTFAIKTLLAQYDNFFQMEFNLKIPLISGKIEDYIIKYNGIKWSYFKLVNDIKNNKFYQEQNTNDYEGEIPHEIIQYHNFFVEPRTDLEFNYLNWIKFHFNVLFNSIKIPDKGYVIEGNIENFSTYFLLKYLQYSKYSRVPYGTEEKLEKEISRRIKGKLIHQASQTFEYFRLA